MRVSPKKINWFLLFKLPSAFFCGVRVKSISKEICVVSVKHRWINQNPFKSMYFAVQAMAAEMSTGALVLSQIRKSEKRISMLVTASKATYTKKATGRIIFTCQDGNAVSAALNRAIISGEGQAMWLKSIGKDEKGDTVSEMDFEWNIKLK